MSEHSHATVERLKLELKVPFRIAHGLSTIRTNAMVQVGDVYGEAALPPYYPTTLSDVESYVNSLDFNWLLSKPQYAIPARIRKLPDGPAPAIAAVDMALLDIWSRAFDRPLYKLLGLNPAKAPRSMLSMSIPETIDDHMESLALMQKSSMLKLKLGSGDLAYDLEIARATRSAYGGRICADANAAWTVPEALDILPKLFGHGLEFIEQPIEAAEQDDWHVLRRMSRKPMPLLIADESVKTAEDVIGLAGAADGVNLKLAKCGGIVRTQDLISLARSLDMKVMLGCMIESSLAITAAAHIASGVDYLDLDAGQYLKQDPFHGLNFDQGRITMPDRSGLGIFRIH